MCVCVCVKLWKQCADNLGADPSSTARSCPIALFAQQETGQNTVTKRTRTCPKTLNPEFGTRTDFKIRSPRLAKVVVNVYDEDCLGTDDFLGTATLPIKDVIANNSLRFEGPVTLDGVDKVRSTSPLNFVYSFRFEWVCISDVRLNYAYVFFNISLSLSLSPLYRRARLLSERSGTRLPRGAEDRLMPPRTLARP